MDFLKKEPNENRRHLILDVVSGLEYLHTSRPHVIHGDLKAANVLITDAKRACLADFGLAAAYDSSVKVVPSSTIQSPGTVRYMAPELFDAESDETYRRSTLKSDMYALACVFYEVYAGTHPFPDISTDAMVQIAVCKGHRSDRPINPSLDDDLWEMTQNCWTEKPEKRPDVQQVKKKLMSWHKGTYEPLRATDDHRLFVAGCTQNSTDHPFSFVLPE